MHPSRSLLAFLAVAFGWSGLAAAAFFFAADQHPAVRVGIGVIYMFGPALGAVVGQRLAGESVRGPLEVKLGFNRYWLIAWLSPLAYALAAAAIALAFPAVTFSADLTGMLERMAPSLTAEQLAEAQTELGSLPPGVFFLVILLQALIAGVSVNALAAFGEELGWRSFLPRALSRVLGPRLGFWSTGLVVGLIWGGWHAPLILQGHNYPQHPTLGVLLMILWCVLLTPWLLHVRERAGSVLPAAILHGSLNASAGLALVPLRGGDDLLVGVTGLAGFLALVPVNLWVLWSRRRPAAAVPGQSR